MLTNDTIFLKIKDKTYDMGMGTIEWIGWIHETQSMIFLDEQNLLLPSTLFPSASSRRRGFLLDNSRVWIVASLLWLGAPEVGHELILVSLLDSWDPVGARPEILTNQRRVFRSRDHSPPIRVQHYLAMPSLCFLSYLYCSDSGVLSCDEAEPSPPPINSVDQSEASI